jgi:ethanolamine utilization protein EutQ
MTDQGGDMEISRQAIEGIIREVVREVVREELGRNAPARRVDPSGVIAIDLDRVELEPFPFPIPAQRVRLADIVSLEESPRLGCGVMELDSESFQWTLKYDEIDYVVSGALDIVAQGRVIRVEAGQVVYIPKDTTISFAATGPVRFVYVCYPANWSQQ